jgi:hypothetical protein
MFRNGFEEVVAKMAQGACSSEEGNLEMDFMTRHGLRGGNPYYVESLPHYDSAA